MRPGPGTVMSPHGNVSSMSDRPRTSAFIATSLDGFIARVDGSIDWLSSVERPGEDYGYAAFMGSTDALVMGRGTYDVARSFPEWPYAGKRVFVMTHRPIEPIAGEERFEGTPSQLMKRCEGLEHLYIDGGAVIRGFLSSGLLDELTVSVLPIALGAGLPLLAGLPREVRFELLRSRSYPSGLVQSTYRVARQG
jgi:dihydrofolate reductase